MNANFDNHYEAAFENWLIDNHIRYERAPQTKRTHIGQAAFKNFDFLIIPETGPKIIAELKGRKFKGTTLAHNQGLQSWVTLDDIYGLFAWQNILSPDYSTIFVFAYQLENIDVDLDGRLPFEFDMNRYLFFCITLGDYKRFMKPRSSKWKTVSIPAETFRQYTVDADKFLLRKISIVN